MEATEDTQINNNAANGAGVEASISEEEKYWSNVTANPADFNSWTYLIQLVEKQGDIESIRKAYDGFLAEYPLCYVYWRKYSEHEANAGNDALAMNVFERGVTGIPHSVDLWTYYCTYVAQKEEDLDKIRGLWERAAITIGTDFVSHPFWDKYLEFETSQEDYARVTAIYHRILKIPMDQITQYYEKFVAHAATRPLTELMTPDEATALQDEKNRHETKFKELNNSKEEGETIDPSEVTSAGIKTGDEIELEFRTRVLAARDATHKKTLEETMKRRPLEYSVLKRPYFHIKPLDESQLQNWRHYLDFEEKDGNLPRIIKLYERCLIACCNYSEFWIRYARWLESRNVEDARKVFQRATTIFLKRRPDVHLEYASFEEAHSDVLKARQIYEHLVSTLPGHVESTLKFASFERRHKNHDVAASIYESALSISSLDSKAGPFLSMQYAQFLTKVQNNPLKAREVLETALQKFTDSKPLWQSYIELEFSQMKSNDYEIYTKVQAIYSRAVGEGSGLSADDKQEMWKNNLEFANDWCHDIHSLRRLHETYRALYPHKPDLKKRPLQSAEGYTQNKQARTSTTTPTTGIPLPTPTAAVAAPAAYYPYTQYGYSAAYPTGYYPQQTAAYGYPYYPYQQPT